MLLRFFQKEKSKEVALLEERVKALEEKLAFGFVNAAVERTGVRSIKQNPNYTYLAGRLRDYEIALLNVKQMGYHIGRGEFGRMQLDARVEEASTTEKVALPSKLCTQDDFESNWCAYWLKELRSGIVLHRKLWEFAYIAQQLYALGALAPGKKGVGFGCGEEPLPSLFAKFGASSIATDLPPTAASGKAWIEAGAHSTNVEKLKRRDICEDEERLNLIEHAFADMNHIPAEFHRGFDFTWSACALEHAGSIKQGLEFIENSLKALKLGGVAVHTTEFNFDDGETLDNWSTVLFQRHHIEGLVQSLTAKGYVVQPLDLDGGSRVLDGLFDIPPWPWEAEKLGWTMLDYNCHLKKSIEGFPCTSIGITVRVPG